MTTTPPIDAAGLAADYWRTDIIDIEPGRIHVRGYPIQELIGQIGFAEMIWLMLRGELPTKRQAALLEAAREQYPGLSFRQALLPELVGIAEGAFDNVLCETVIMHLPPEQIGAAVQRLVSLLRAGGTLYLSWRVTPDADQRDGRGRLYAAFDAAPVREALAGTEIVFDEAAVSQSSGKTIHRIVARQA